MSVRPAQIGTAALLALTLLTGCRRDSDRRDHAAPPDPNEPGLSATVTPQQVRFGDVVTLTLEARLPADEDVRWPSLEALDGFDVIDTEDDDPRATPTGLLRWRRTVDLAPTRSGQLEIPPLTVERVAAADPAATIQKPRELTSEPLAVRVASLLQPGDTISQPRAVTGPLAAERPAADTPSLGLPWWAWLALSGGAVLLAIAAVWLVVRLTRSQAATPSADATALAALANLERQRLTDAGRVREHYYRLSEIVRTYIERRFGWHAPEMTTPEFLASIGREGQSLGEREVGHLRAFLEACDLVKYAASTPDPLAAAAAVESARAFIRATAPIAIGRPQAGGQAA